MMIRWMEVGLKSGVLILEDRSTEGTAVNLSNLRKIPKHSYEEGREEDAHQVLSWSDEYKLGKSGEPISEFRSKRGREILEFLENSKKHLCRRMRRRIASFIAIRWMKVGLKSWEPISEVRSTGGGGGWNFGFFWKFQKASIGKHEKKTHIKFNRDQMNGSWFKIGRTNDWRRRTWTYSLGFFN